MNAKYDVEQSDEMKGSYSAFPFDMMQPLELTSAGRPALHQSEVEVYSEDNISLYDHEAKTPYKYGRCVITTHRLLYIQEQASPVIALCLPLSLIIKLTKEAGFLSRSAKLRLDVGALDSGRINAYMKLSFKRGGRDEFHGPLCLAIDRKAWVEIKAGQLVDRRLQDRPFSTSDAGIAGILRRQHEEQQRSAELTATAFSDLTNLMSRAKDLVEMIERYSAKVKSIETSSEKNEHADEMSLLNSLMLDMGIISPVTRENAGSSYYHQLARQLAEFLATCMSDYGGIMTLSDIYCLFNRARGVELVSPDDLVEACHLQQELQLGFHIRKFASGLIVLQADSFREDRMAKRLKQMAEKSNVGYLTVTEVSVEMKISYPLAHDYLKAAEELQELCRDDTLEGINFYPNYFDSYVKVLCT
uniref:Vacuolar protein-sorting-associated protein 36 n=1 Tax=Albugo laibachii Nc14 TaxID=890382 RepID=F0VZA8_9STRA|nr:vacuolar proteinsortingassociated protein putative [Albugo laibachii Nc14]|eukprot:CCA14138.1 vacuolar proteinsortingassociated protein putative [Albugo laibachii Nc14]